MPQCRHVSLDVGVGRVFGRQNGRQKHRFRRPVNGFRELPGHVAECWTLVVIIRAMPPNVASCRSSGGQNGGQDHGLMSTMSLVSRGVVELFLPPSHFTLTASGISRH